MSVEIDEDMIRLLVINISCVYSQIENEMYIDENKELDIRNQYSDTSKYIVVRTM